MAVAVAIQESQGEIVVAGRTGNYGQDDSLGSKEAQSHICLSLNNAKTLCFLKQFEVVPQPQRSWGTISNLP